MFWISNFSLYSVKILFQFSKSRSVSPPYINLFLFTILGILIHRIEKSITGLHGSCGQVVVQGWVREIGSILLSELPSTARSSWPAWWGEAKSPRCRSLWSHALAPWKLLSCGWQRKAFVTMSPGTPPPSDSCAAVELPEWEESSPLLVLCNKTFYTFIDCGSWEHFFNWKSFSFLTECLFRSLSVRKQIIKQLIFKLQKVTHM